MSPTLRVPVAIVAVCCVVFAGVWVIGAWQEQQNAPEVVQSRQQKEDQAQRTLAQGVVLNRWWLTAAPATLHLSITSPEDGTLIAFMQGVDGSGDVVSHASLESVTCVAGRECVSKGFLVQGETPRRRALRVELDVGRKGLLRLIFTDDTSVAQDPSFVVLPLPAPSPP
jgi:hypothetical protein